MYIYEMAIILLYLMILSKSYRNCFVANAHEKALKTSPNQAEAFVGPRRQRNPVARGSHIARDRPSFRQKGER